jgi:surface polysaccharide O-acyltransferase-like enzyme
MTTLWFRARRYGWGWRPCSIEGWLVLLMFIAAVFASALIFNIHIRNGGDVATSTIVYAGTVVALAAALIAVCWKTGERPRWNWGKRE